MNKRIAAITFIYVCTTVAWMILARTVFVRSDEQSSKLRGEVGQLWGTQLVQSQPMVTVPAKKIGECAVSVPLESSDINVGLNLDYRRKGLLWYSTYHVDFVGKYQLANSNETRRDMTFSLVFPSQKSVYDDFHLTVDGVEVDDAEFDPGVVSHAVSVGPGEVKEIGVYYKTQGMDQWSYNFGQNVEHIKNFSLVINTDFDNIDFPQKSISPVKNESTKTGKKLTWQYDNLMTGVSIGMIMPKKLNPGPWVGQLTSAAPVSLFLFFFLMMVITSVRNIKLHPMHYFFLGCSFFSFHLLMAYLVDHVSVHTAFWICSAVSVFLVLSYMRIVTGTKFAMFEVGLSQFIYLVLFSYTFFFKGYTGLAITVLCICTLFIVMQFTAKVDWEKVFVNNDKSKCNKPVPRQNKPEFK